MYKTITECRACKSPNLETILDLGNIYPSNFINTEPALDYSDQAPVAVPFTLVKCSNCELVQLLHTVDLDLMYRHYWYKSSINPSMKESLKNIVESIEKRVELEKYDKILDIGCNDAVMFDYYTRDDLIKIGFDPAYNLMAEALKRCTRFANNYFTSEEFFRIGQTKAKVVTSIAMLYDLEDPNIFVEDIKKILREDGLWVIQFTDLYSMFKINDISNVCLEHLEYYGINWLKNFLESHGLEVFDIEQNSTNGGSTRFYVSWPGVFNKTDNYYRLLEEEKIYMNSFSVEVFGKKYNDAYKAFASRVEDNKRKFLDFLNFCKSNKIPVHALGASTKANTLLQSWKVDKSLIQSIGEISKDKFGLKTIGTEIPIVPESELLDKPVLVILTWQFKSFFLFKLKDYVENGGNLVFPLPEFEVIHKEKFNGN